MGSGCADIKPWQSEKKRGQQRNWKVESVATEAELSYAIIRIIFTLALEWEETSQRKNPDEMKPYAV